MDNALVDKNQFNIGYLCTTRQCEVGRGDKIALRFLTSHQKAIELTFSGLDVLSNKIAHALEGLGFSAGDTIFTFLPRIPELYYSLLGILKMCGIAGPLFTTFGEEALLHRLRDSGAKGLITQRNLLRKVVRIRKQLPALKFIILIDADHDESSEVLSFSRLLSESPNQFLIPETEPERHSLIHYTSGSTGQPKGVQHVHKSILHIQQTMREILQLSQQDTYWCTADPGWVTGTSYGIVGPWSMGVTQIQYGGSYDAAAWMSILEKEGVTVWYTAPTALRMLMQEDPHNLQRYDLSKIRAIFSVGEPLNPEILSWSRNVLGKEVYDTWFQTETGGIMIANRPGLPIKPGSMGVPVNGIEAAILSDLDERVTVHVGGHLCLKPGWASMFVGFKNNQAAYVEKFRNGYYHSGDTAYRDEDGYFWFTGRSDDVINTAGHLISPFEIESALLEVEEVAESAAIAAPDAILFEKVVVYVALRRGFEWSAELEVKLRIHVANRVSTIATPQEILVISSIPKTKSGKIMRRVLKSMYLGEDPGDLSTMEE